MAVLTKPWTQPPQGAAPINWGHPLLASCELLVVPDETPQASLDRFRLAQPTLGGTVTASVTPRGGLGRTLFHNGAGAKLEFGNRPTSSARSLTLLWIGRLRAISGSLSTLLLHTSNTDTGYNLHVGTTGLFRMTVGGVGTRSSGVTLVADVPYLLAASRLESAAGLIDFVVRRLDNGQVQVATTSGAYTPVASSGVYVVGDTGFGTTTANHDLALALVANRFYPAQTLAGVTADVWSIFARRRPVLEVPVIVAGQAPRSIHHFRQRRAA